MGIFKASAYVTVSLTLHWSERVMDAGQGNVLFAGGGWGGGVLHSHSAKDTDV